MIDNFNFLKIAEICKKLQLFRVEITNYELTSKSEGIFNFTFSKFHCPCLLKLNVNLNPKI